MSNVLVESAFLTAIANAIRSKLGVETTYKPSEMADAIEDISGGTTPTGTKEINITSNGTIVEDVTNYASAEINVNVQSGASPVIESLAITENGTYTAPSGVDGYSPVTVNVGSGGYSTSDILNRVAPAGAIIISRNPYPYEFYINTAITSVETSGSSVGTSAFAGCTSLQSFKGTASRVAMGDGMFQNCSNLTTIDAAFTGINSSVFQNCTSLVTIDQPYITSIGRNTFAGCTSLKTVKLTGCTTSGNDAGFSGCTALESVDFNSSYNGQIKASMFANCSSLPLIDCKNATAINANAFNGASALKKIILRKTGTITTLANISAFTGTPFASGGTGGTIYVPSALISTYQTASNWSTLYGYGTVTFTAIEGSDYE